MVGRKTTLRPIFYTREGEVTNKFIGGKQIATETQAINFS